MLGAVGLPDINPIANSLTDMDDVPVGHYWFWLCNNGTVTNFPPVSTGNNKRCFVELTKSPSGYQHQRVVNVYSGNPLETFERFKGGSSVNWSSWYRTDNYGTSSLSELASALKPYL